MRVCLRRMEPFCLSHWVSLSRHSGQTRGTQISRSIINNCTYTKGMQKGVKPASKAEMETNAIDTCQIEFL